VTAYTDRANTGNWKVNRTQHCLLNVSCNRTCILNVSCILRLLFHFPFPDGPHALLLTGMCLAWWNRDVEEFKAMCKCVPTQRSRIAQLRIRGGAIDTATMPEHRATTDSGWSYVQEQIWAELNPTRPTPCSTPRARSFPIRNRMRFGINKLVQTLFPLSVVPKRTHHGF